MGRQHHRGQHEKDKALFSPAWVDILNEAITDLAYLFNRNYADNASLSIVGNRYQLRKRQRLALLRGCCTDAARQRRAETLVPAEMLQGEQVYVDGYNLLITVESILGGGIILACRDGCIRDISSVHGTYRKVEETHEALILLGKSLEELQVKGVHWYLDAPVSNSGRLKSLMYELANDHDFPWEIELVNNPDQELVAKKKNIIITSDRWILDNINRWFNLSQYILDKMPERGLIELKGM